MNANQPNHSVRVVVDTVPTYGGHHVAVKSEARGLLWSTGGETPQTIEVTEGEELLVSVRCPLPTRKGLDPREEHVVVPVRATASGGPAVVRVGKDGVNRPLYRVVVLVIGAERVS